MNVTLCSHFRNASEYLPRYFSQVSDLEHELWRRNDQLAVVWCEGDSTDDTWGVLNRYCSGIGNIADSLYASHLFQCHHDGADYGSIVHPQRFANLAKVCNAMWERLPLDADAVVWMESDLIWEPSTVLALLDHLATVPAVAPMVMLRREGYAPWFFYDFWAFRKDGRHFSSNPPYLPPWSEAFRTGQAPTELTQIDSAGSCLVMRGDVARGVHWPSEDVVVGVCRQIYEQGGSVWLEPNLSVIHE